MERSTISSTEAGIGEAMTIGQVAAITGITAETIRFYEREGVVPAPARRGAGRYRRYARADAERLRFIRRARDLGFSLQEVRELLTLATEDPERSCRDVNALAKVHLKDVDAKLSQLAALRAELARLIRACNRDRAIANCALLNALGSP